MVLNRKQQRKQRRGTKQFASGCGTRKSKRAGVLQYGGVSPACVFDGASRADTLYQNAGANIHNTNPQASLDLDNKFMNYGSAVPLGNNIMQGGAANCGDEGRGGAGNGKTETFKQYLDGLANQYTVGGGDMSAPAPMETNSEPTRAPMTPMENNSEPSMAPMDTSSDAPMASMAPMQTAGGFSTDPSEYIAGLPVYKAYDDCCPPAIVNNQLVMGAPDQPVCGLGAIKGGARRRSRATSSRKHKRSTKRSSKNNKSRRVSKRKNNSRRSRRQSGGGDFVYSANQSKPAPMSEAFNGPMGVFRYPDDMMTRRFDEVQPNYSVNAI